MSSLVLTALVVGTPAVAFVVNSIGGRRLGKAPGYIAVGALLVSLLSSITLLVRVIQAHGEAVVEESFLWARIGTESLRFGFYVDGLSASVLVMVGAVASMVFIYAIGYMASDERFGWFFAVFSLFTCSMFGLVTSSNLLEVLLFWEIMGLCSYLLIGFWYTREEARSASIKAFLTTRVGDMGFLIGIALLLARYHTLDIPELFGRVGAAAGLFMTVVTLMLFWAAVGKSAQFPLYFWLPSAMAGPTPVSGLLHSATMVAAGVFLVARTYPLFEAAPFTLPFVVFSGMFSALFAASLALTETDIKRTLAYSTMSQLGYMMGALGAGGYVAGVFHLIAHGFFKSLLFLGAGSVIHGVATQDVRQMGGLARPMKWTAATFLVGALALAGVPPLAGFFSKDAVLGSLWMPTQSPEWLTRVFFIVGLMTAVLTAFYMFRVYFMVFSGKRNEHAHESATIMLGPQTALSGLTILGGLLNLPLGYALLTSILEPEGGEHAVWWLMLLSIMAAGAGIYIAWEQNRTRLSAGTSTYSRYDRTRAEKGHYLERVYGSVFLRPVFAVSQGLRTLNWDGLVGIVVVQPVLSVSNWLDRHETDVIYDVFFLRFVGGAAEVLRWFDTTVVDGVVNYLGAAGVRIAGAFGRLDLNTIDGAVDAIGTGTLGIGRRLRRLQTGVLANYALFMVLFAVVLFYLARWLAR